MSTAIERFFAALRARDYDDLAASFTPNAKLRALVPTALREEDGPDAIVARFKVWIGDLGEYEFTGGEVDDVLGQVHVRYRFRGIDPEDGLSETEQHAYATVEDGRISRLNIVCTGFRPVA